MIVVSDTQTGVQLVVSFWGALASDLITFYHGRTFQASCQRLTGLLLDLHDPLCPEFLNEIYDIAPKSFL
jgi:membrane protein DedA with SNARE-associated domain